MRLISKLAKVQIIFLKYNMGTKNAEFDDEFESDEKSQKVTEKLSFLLYILLYLWSI